MPENPIRYWQSLTTSDVARAVERDPVVILPIAAIEQHGPHLPLSTDLDIGMGLLASAFGHLEEDFPAWVLPPLPVGASEEHMRLPGTLSLAPDTLSRIIYQYGAALSTSGVRRLVLSNSHGGNRAALSNAGLRLRRKHGLLVVKVSYFEFPPPEIVDASSLGVAPWTTRRRRGDGDDAPLAPRSGAPGRDPGCTPIGSRTRSNHASPDPGRRGVLLLAR